MSILTNVDPVDNINSVPVGGIVLLLGYKIETYSQLLSYFLIFTILEKICSKSKKFEELGYEILSSKKLEDKSEHKYQVNISRVDNAIYSHVNEIVWELVEIAESLDGYYDGWGCNITK